MTALITADDILGFYAGRRHGNQYLALENGDIVHLGADDIDGTPKAYAHVTTASDTEAQILLDVDTILEGNWFPDALDEDGNLRPEVATEMAKIINADAGLTVAAAVAEAVEAGKVAERDAQTAQASALARARSVMRVVELCGGNQSEAARRLGLDQSTVNKLIRKEKVAAVNRAILSVPLLQNPDDEQAQEMVKRAITASEER